MRRLSHTSLVLLIATILVLALLLWFYKTSKVALQKKDSDLNCRDCNVLFIGIDALQASHVSHLGYFRDTTPTLDKLASRGFSFSQAISPSSWTVPAYMSIFTSTYPSIHRLTNRYVIFSPTDQKLSNFKELSPNLLTFAEIMKQVGYQTGGFTGDAGVGAVLGYNHGFDIYVDDVRFGGFENSEKYALKWLDEHKGQKFFMFFHGYDTHGQYDIGQGYKSRYIPKDYHGSFVGTKEEQGKLREEGLKNGLINLTDEDVKFWRAWYDGKIRDADDRLSTFLSELEKRDLLKKTIIVVFSDHGTEFFEHKRFDHGHTLYDELVHVPLIIVIPGVKSEKIITQQVTTLDIASTVLDILSIYPNISFQSQIKGESLLPLMIGKSNKGRDIFIETDYRNYTHKRAIRTADGWKYILTLDDSEEELYNLNKDPQEKNNLVSEEPERRNDLQQKLYYHITQTLKQNPKEVPNTSCLPAYPDQCK